MDGSNSHTVSISTPDIDIEEINIQDIIGGYYGFFQSLVQMRDVVDCSNDIGHETRETLLELLDSIEGHCRDSHEWILSRDVQELRMGVVGASDSCKSTLISAFHEGVVEMGEDDPHGRYKIKIMVGSKPCLLMVREETMLVSRQLSQWADILMLVFSYSSLDSLNQLTDMYKMFTTFRCDTTNPSILIVGVVDDVMSKIVSEADVRQVASDIDNCRVSNTTLSNPGAVQNVFIDACRHHLLSLSSFLPSSNPCPPSPSIGHSYTPGSGVTPSGHAGGLNSANHQKLLNEIVSSPMTFKKGNKRKSVLVKHGSQKAVGTGRIIPVKEGQVYKKSPGGMRSDWKKKYLVLTETELTYYPNITDYMNQTHGKKVSLQHITVKVPGQFMPIAKSTNLSPSASLPPDISTTTAAASQSDCSESTSPSAVFPEKLNSNGESTDSAMPITVTLSSPPDNKSRQPKSSVSDDTMEELTKSDKYPFSHRVISHSRNNSMDEATLHYLKSQGAMYPPTNPEEQPRERSSTLTRLTAKKPRMIMPSAMLSPISHSEEELSEPQRVGSAENLKSKKGKKGDKDRNSLVMVERTSSDNLPMREDSKKEKKNPPNKHKRIKSQGQFKSMEVEGYTANETSEFHIHSAEGKVWCFDSSNADEMTEWVRAIEAQIKKFLEESLLPKKNVAYNEEAKTKILSIKGNDLCADCGAQNPEWASLNHGCMVCIECSGVHRKLGSHISRVRSLHLDEWRPELVAVMTAVGNETSWKILEARRTKPKPSPNSSVEERERYIRAKYVDKEFVADLPCSTDSISTMLLESVKNNDPILCMHLLAHATTEDINKRQHADCHGGSILHVACNLGRTVMVELLVWNFANVDMLDYQKRSPLFYARIAGHEDCAQILIQHNCNEDIGLYSPHSSDFGSTEVLS